MNMDKLDYKKEYKDLYLPKNKPATIDVPEMTFIMVDGKGAPESEEYKNSIELLYGLSFTIKMSHKSGHNINGYFEYVVPPLEGLWWIEGEAFDFSMRDKWLWTSMIRQPEFVTEEVFNWAVESLKKKKPSLDVSKARYKKFTEGLCVQIMHVGPYANEPETLKLMREFMQEKHFKDETGSIRKHHEIYLSDPRRVHPDKIKTVLRHPVTMDN